MLIETEKRGRSPKPKQYIRFKSKRTRQRLIDVQTTSTKFAGKVPDLPLTFPVHLGGNPVGLLVLIQSDSSTYHVSAVPVFSVIVMTSPFENEISPGYSTNHVSRRSQPQWVSTNLDCIEIKQRDRPSNTFSRSQRSGQLRLGCDNESVQYW